MIEALLSAETPAEYLRRFNHWWESDLDKDRLVLRAARYVAPRSYRDEYSHNALHGYLGMIAAVQAGNWLNPRVRMDPLTQALWAVAGENLSDPFDFNSFEGEALAGVLRQPIEELWKEGNVAGLCAGIGHSTDKSVREGLVAWLMRRAMSDTWDFGRRLTYMAGAVRLCRWAQWESGEILLFPAIHYALRAPADNGAAQWLATILDHNPIRQDHIAGAGRELNGEQAAELAALALSNDAEGLVAYSLGLLSEGASPQALYEGLLMAAARLLVCSSPADWYGPVHVILYLDALKLYLDPLKPALAQTQPTSQVEAILLGGLALQRAAGLQESLFTGAPECELPQAAPSNAFSLWASLAAALDEGDEPAALGIVASAVEGGYDSRVLSSFFASYASRNDGRLYSAVDLQFVCAIMLASARARPKTRNRLLAALVHFLSTCEKDHTMWRQIAQG